MKHLILALPFLFAVAPAADAEGKGKTLLPGQGIDWKGDWDAAVQEATARNVPIAYHVHKDG